MRFLTAKINNENLKAHTPTMLRGAVVKTVNAIYAVHCFNATTRRSRLVVTAITVLDQWISEGDACEDVFADHGQFYSKRDRHALRVKINHALASATKKGELSSSTAMKGNKEVRGYEPAEPNPIF